MKTNIIFVCLFILLSVAACGKDDVPAQQLTLQGLDIKFDRQTLLIKAGQPVELTYQNKGSIDHAFQIDGLVDNVKIRPGQTRVFKFTVARPGEYKFVCAMPGHEIAGMVGILRVEP
jgi:uncharacterized cupredoxin-like copper-binding protein